MLQALQSFYALKILSKQANRINVRVLQSNLESESLPVLSLLPSHCRCEDVASVPF